MTNEDNCHVLVRFKNNALGVITVSWCNEPTDVLEVFGTQGTLRVDPLARDPLSYKPRKLKRKAPMQEILQGDFKSKKLPQHQLIDHFIECILKGKQEHPNFEDGKRATEFVLEAYSLK
jgi:predicted dehydrogenase